MKFRVRFYKNVTTCDRHSIEVEAANEVHARAKVTDWGKGEIELTDAELATENLEKEGEVVETEFDSLEDEDDANAVVPA